MGDAAVVHDDLDGAEAQTGKGPRDGLGEIGSK
jgi:hypothetical protein